MRRAASCTGAGMERVLRRKISLTVVLAVTLAFGAPLTANAAPSQPSIYLQPNQGPPGTRVAVTGTGWTPNTPVQGWFDMQVIANVIADGQGGFKSEFVVPSVPNGPYPVNFTAQTERYPAVFTVADQVGANPGLPPSGNGLQQCEPPTDRVPFPELAGKLSDQDRKQFWTMMCTMTPPGLGLDPEGAGRITFGLWRLGSMLTGLPNPTDPSLFKYLCGLLGQPTGTCFALDVVRQQVSEWLADLVGLGQAPTTATVPATAQWVDTGIDVSADRALTIRAQGTWRDGDTTSGPAGASKAWPDNFLNLTDLGVCNYCARTMTGSWDALIGYIGDRPPAPGSYTSKDVLLEARKIFVVGDQYAVQNAPATGRLWLDMNADAYSNYTVDNSGSVAATVTVE